MIYEMPVTYEDSVELFSDILNRNRRVQLLGYEGGITTPLDVIDYSIDPTTNESNPTIVLNLTYRYPVFDSNVRAVDKLRRIRFLSSDGDVIWTNRMRMKVWDNKYPTTVAVDEDSKEIFFVRLYDNYISLEVFATLSEDQFELYQEDLDDRSPFRIFISDEAMFQYIDGAEGLNGLLNGVYVEFNCSVPLRIYREERIEM